jgi:hypothetical protein
MFGHHWGGPIGFHGGGSRVHALAHLTALSHSRRTGAGIKSQTAHPGRGGVPMDSDRGIDAKASEVLRAGCSSHAARATVLLTAQARFSSSRSPARSVVSPRSLARSALLRAGLFGDLRLSTLICEEPRSPLHAARWTGTVQ